MSSDQRAALDIEAAIDLELAPGLRLELAYRRLDVAFDDVGFCHVGSLSVVEGTYLGRTLTVGDRIALVVVRPVRFPDLPGPAPKQHVMQAPP
ncbi:MAG: hypothetical protein ACHQ01_06285 [Candidatus Limnocylindrales bacterium]